MKASTKNKTIETQTSVFCAIWRSLSAIAFLCASHCSFHTFNEGRQSDKSGTNSTETSLWLKTPSLPYLS